MCRNDKNTHMYAHITQTKVVTRVFGQIVLLSDSTIPCLLLSNQHNNFFPQLYRCKNSWGFVWIHEWVSGWERENVCSVPENSHTARCECGFKAQFKRVRLFHSSWHAGSHGDDDDDEVLGSSCQALVIFAHFTIGAIRDTSRANSVLLSLSLSI